jgi:hypothetical protein
MAKTAHYSHTALAGALSGGRLPSRELTLAFVLACGGDQETWQARWDQTSTSIEREPRLEPVFRPPRWPRAALVAAVVVAAVAGGGVTMMVLRPDTLARSHQQPPATAPPSPVVAPISDNADRPLVPGDAARFVADITIPNGLIVHTNQHFTKIWAVRNTGTVYWRNRYLERYGVLQAPELCGSPQRVPVPDTAPGQEVQISVAFTAPSLPGSCKTAWSMTDGNGHDYFPAGFGLFMVVNVEGQ